MLIYTKKDWWTAVDLYWAELFQLAYVFLGERWMRSPYVDSTKSIHSINNSQYIIELKKTHNPDLCHVFQKIWAAAPDSSGIHQADKWDVLCDLCSESWVLDEGEVNEFHSLSAEDSDG